MWRPKKLHIVSEVTCSPVETVSKFEGWQRVLGTEELDVVQERQLRGRRHLQTLYPDFRFLFRPSSARRCIWWRFENATQNFTTWISRMASPCGRSWWNRPSARCCLPRIEWVSYTFSQSEPFLPSDSRWYLEHELSFFLVSLVLLLIDLCWIKFQMSLYSDSLGKVGRLKALSKYLTNLPFLFHYLLHSVGTRWSASQSSPEFAGSPPPTTACSAAPSGLSSRSSSTAAKI